MKAKELLSRYRQEERNFREVDLRGESLRGMNLTGSDLSGANLTETDLRGTKFTNAKLIGTQFCKARMGTQRHWTILVVLLLLLLSALTAILLASLIAPSITAIIQPSQDVFSSGNKIIEIVAGTCVLGSVTAALIFNYSKGISAILGPLVSSATLSPIASAFVIAGAAMIAIIGGFAVVFAVAITIAGPSVIAVAGISAVVFTVFKGSFEALLTGALTATLILSYASFSLVISRRALSGDLRDKLTRDLAVGLFSVGGTSFRGADLTDADFSQAIVKSTHFKETNLTRTRFHLSKNLHLSRAYKTGLANRTVLNLLVSLRPEEGKSYVGLNLQGANLRSAKLADLDLTETNLSNATLEDADMQRSLLNKAQARNTNFHQTNLTAACLEDWNIDRNTRLDGAICEHVYLLQDRQERRPKSGTFVVGELAKLFEGNFSTSELVLRNSEVERKATLESENQRIQSRADIIESYHQRNTDMTRIAETLAQRPIIVDVKATATSKAMQGNDESQNFDIQGNFTINADNSVVSLRDISGQVSNQINQLGGSETQVQLRELLTQLQSAIKSEPTLSEAEIVEALEEVKIIAEAGQTVEADSSKSKKLAKRAMNALRGMTAGLMETTKLVEVCGRLLPAIGLLFGL